MKVSIRHPQPFGYTIDLLTCGELNAGGWQMQLQVLEIAVLPLIDAGEMLETGCFHAGDSGHSQAPART
ncbi:MAG: hypothetical protein KZQ96_03155 [Candidatus Thiodiazotropha sp. (ex Lucinoma borealis)]|nr:hypothetical protein [Candidatus Thiodiazotropha sp. (ex Lucinoma borealis)]